MEGVADLLWHGLEFCSQHSKWLEWPEEVSSDGPSACEGGPQEVKRGYYLGCFPMVWERQPYSDLSLQQCFPITENCGALWRFRGFEKSEAPDTL